MQKLEEEIRELEAKIDTLTEIKEMPEPSEDRKSLPELRKQLLQEIQMYTPTTSYYQEDTQSRPSGEDCTLSSSKQESQDQESSNKAYTVEKVCAKHSNLSFTINNLLSVVWDKPRRRFILRCPYNFKMAKSLHKIKTKLFLQLPGITILVKRGSYFSSCPHKNGTECSVYFILTLVTAWHCILPRSRSGNNL